MLPIREKKISGHKFEMTPPKRQRLYFILGTLICVAFSATVLLTVFQEAVLFFYTPSELSTKSHDQLARPFRLGGIVVKDSVHHVIYDQKPSVTFEVSDGIASQKISFTGVLPDLFREGQGIVAEGSLQDPEFLKSGKSTLFQATTVLAKHDETYMPPDLEKGLTEAKQKAIVSLKP